MFQQASYSGATAASQLKHTTSTVLQIQIIHIPLLLKSHRQCKKNKIYFTNRKTNDMYSTQSSTTDRKKWCLSTVQQQLSSSNFRYSTVYLLVLRTLYLQLAFSSKLRRGYTLYYCRHGRKLSKYCMKAFKPPSSNTTSRVPLTPWRRDR